MKYDIKIIPFIFFIGSLCLNAFFFSILHYYGLCSSSLSQLFIQFVAMVIYFVHGVHLKTKATYVAFDVICIITLSLFHCSLQSFLKLLLFAFGFWLQGKYSFI